MQNIGGWFLKQHAILVFRSSRTSFQENYPENHAHGGTEKKRKSIPSMPIFRLRVSAIPEMSDISESCSSNSAEDYEKRCKQKHKVFLVNIINRNFQVSITSRLAVDESTRKRSKSNNEYSIACFDKYKAKSTNCLDAVKEVDLTVRLLNPSSRIGF